MIYMNFEGKIYSSRSALLFVVFHKFTENYLSEYCFIIIINIIIIIIIINFFYIGNHMNISYKISILQ